MNKWFQISIYNLHTIPGSGHKVQLDYYSSKFFEDNKIMSLMANKVLVLPKVTIFTLKCVINKQENSNVVVVFLSILIKKWISSGMSK